MGCEQDDYPQYGGYYDNYPKLSYFPFRETSLSYPTTSYSFETSIDTLDGCGSVDVCDYCDSAEELLLYMIAQAKVKYYWGGYWYYKTAYMSGDWIFYYNGYWALQHEFLADAECCD